MRRQRGFTYLWLLFAVAGMGLLLAAAAQSWETAARREREAELLFIGGQFARALHSYRERTPGAEKQYPLSLEDLVEDRRFPEPQRHLRRLYRDPVTRGTDWGLVRSGGRIVGVHSLSGARPLRTHFGERFAAFAAAARYDQWVFGPELAAPTSASAPGPADASSTDLARPVEEEPPARESPACDAAYIGALRQCVAALAGQGSARLQQCNAEAAARYATCRE